MTSLLNNKILIAEKDELIRKDLEEYLGTLKYDVKTVSNEQELKVALESTKYSVALLDWYFSKKNVLDILMELKQSDSLLSVVLVSRDPDINSILTAFRYGADDLLIKPFVVDELDEILNKAINQYDIKRKQRAFWKNLKKIETLLAEKGIDPEKELYETIV